MVKSELLCSVAEKMQIANPAFNTRETEKVVAMLMEIWIEALANGERIEVRGFGSISLRYRAPRNNARNPKNGDMVITLEKWRVHFKAGLEMRKKVNTSFRKNIATNLNENKVTERVAEAVE